MNPFQRIFAGMTSAFVEEPTEKPTDVISMIKADHRKTDELFKQYMKSKDDAEKESILQEIINDLRVHATAEESKVYPILDSADHDGANESLEEHHLIKILIEELSSNRLADDKIDAKVKVLSEVVKHHVKEEEGKYLPELKESGADLDVLGEKFASEKERLMGEPDLVGAPVATDDQSMFERVPDKVLADDAVEVKMKVKVTGKSKAPAKKSAEKKPPVAKTASKKVAAKKTTIATAKQGSSTKLKAVKTPAGKSASKASGRRKAS